ncbi:MAG: dimethyl sulfoxide reductase anchor subunit [Betaproteobacteria bacterium]|nr:dimethyl sulfoxide reductase anchor subunit [Betaproteobacteria bacterium]
MSFGPNPWQQQSWDARAAANFMCGGAGSGLIVVTGLGGGPVWALAVGAALVALGLFSVFMEIGRPLRAMNVVRHPGRSWMTREALVAPLLFASVAGAWLAPAAWLPAGATLAALAALAFVYCQGRMLQAAKGIPAWREPLVVPLVVATALAEGGGLWLLLTVASGPAITLPWAVTGLALLARWALWLAWRNRLRAAPRALAAIDSAGRVFKAATLLPLVAAALALASPLPPAALAALQALAGALALAGGLWFKFTLVTRGAYNQGFALTRLPVRGVRRSQALPRRDDHG